ncbi:MAG: hypothetical protein L6R41_004078 [Letrouitia leprolyta]|nr:MAG: hypothetical protein L6R41_004078 [Letrouitia leprolyta]
MATQDVEKSAITTNPCATDEEVKRLEEDIDTAKGHEKLLRANLAALLASSSVDDILANIVALELEKEELSDHLVKLQSRKIKLSFLAEKEAVDKTWDDWKRKAESSKKVFMEMWTLVRDGLPEGQKGERLWDELRLGSEEK